MNDLMEKLVALCKRRGFIYQSSEIYGGINGFWDYGPLGVELKRNVKEAWWHDMATSHDDLATPPGAPRPYAMVGLDSAIIMNPKVWEASGHLGGFADLMSTCKYCKKLYRADHVWEQISESDWAKSLSEKYQDLLERGEVLAMEDLQKWAAKKGKKLAPNLAVVRDPRATLPSLAERYSSATEPIKMSMQEFIGYLSSEQQATDGGVTPCPSCGGDLTTPRPFNLMFRTYIGAAATEDDVAFLRPETAQGIFANFRNVIDTTRVKLPFGIAQVGKAFRNEINPRNFTYRSREFEQMEIEFFCRAEEASQWYEYWRDHRLKWYTNLGLKSDRLRLREHDQDELAHYAATCADVEYAFPFGVSELEGIANRTDFDVKAHAERSGKDLSYFDDQTRERFIPYVIEPSAGVDRSVLAFLCEAYTEDEVPDEKGKPQKRTTMKLHPRLAPTKAAVFPLVKREGMPEIAVQIYRDLKQAGFKAFYDEKGAVGRRYRRQDEAGTPFCITIDSQTLQDQTVTFRDRDTCRQWRVPVTRCVEELKERLKT